jgi:hypothetical protein
MAENEEDDGKWKKNTYLNCNDTSPTSKNRGPFATVEHKSNCGECKKKIGKGRRKIYLKCDDTSPTVSNGSAIIRAKERLRRRSKMIGNGKKPRKTTVIPSKTPRREKA